MLALDQCINAFFAVTYRINPNSWPRPHIPETLWLKDARSSQVGLQPWGLTPKLPRFRGYGTVRSWHGA